MGLDKNFLLITVSLSLIVSTHAIPLFHSIAPSLPPTISPIWNKALEATHNTFKPSHEIIAFCSGTENPLLCADTITPYIREGSFDPIQALDTEVRATLNQSMKVAAVIAESLIDPTTDLRARDALSICKSQYKNIISTIKEAAELLEQQNVVDAYFKFSSVISDQSACEDAFTESPGVKIPFPDDSFTVFQLGGNCLAIMDGIVNSRTQFLI